MIIRLFLKMVLLFVNDITLYTGIAYLFNATSLDRTHGISFGKW